MKLKFFSIAKQLSYKSEYHHKLGAVVIKKGKILGIGFNKPNKTHPRSPHPFKTIHAEFDAIIGMSREDLKGSTIYVYREGANGKPILAKPCKYCAELIRLANIKEVCYTINDGYKKEYV